MARISIATAVNRRLRGRAEHAWQLSPAAGVIPETALFTVVVQPEEIVVGTFNEGSVKAMLAT